MFRASPESGLAWVTGASSGVGRAVALNLARVGYRIAATAPTQADLAEVVRAGPPGAILAYPGDITRPADMARVVEEMETRHGPIALAFLNAGINLPDDPAGFDAAVFRQTVDLNLIGTANCLAPLLGRMRSRGAGQIAINASSAGYGGLPKALSYGASKAGLIHLAESLRFTCAADGLRIQLVSLGFVRTPLTDRNQFAMPFMISAEAAAARICVGLARGGFEIVVPRRLVWVLKALNVLPYPLYFALTGRLTGARPPGQAR